MAAAKYLVLTVNIKPVLEFLSAALGFVVNYLFFSKLARIHSFAFVRCKKKDNSAQFSSEKDCDMFQK